MTDDFSLNDDRNIHQEVIEHSKNTYGTKMEPAAKIEQKESNKRTKKAVKKKEEKSEKERVYVL